MRGAEPFPISCNFESTVSFLIAMDGDVCAREGTTLEIETAYCSNLHRLFVQLFSCSRHRISKTRVVDDRGFSVISTNIK